MLFILWIEIYVYIVHKVMIISDYSRDANRKWRKEEILKFYGLFLLNILWIEIYIIELMIKSAAYSFENVDKAFVILLKWRRIYIYVIKYSTNLESLQEYV